MNRDANGCARRLNYEDDFPFDAEDRSIGRFSVALVLVVSILILGLFDKVIFGHGGVALGPNAQQAASVSAYNRATSFTILLTCLFLLLKLKIPAKNLKFLTFFWAALIALILIRIPFLEGDLSVFLRSMNFISVIFFGMVFASHDGLSLRFYSFVYYLTFVTNGVGLLLYIGDSPFAYFTDGYGKQFVAFFYQKDLLSSTAAIGVIIALIKLRRRWTNFDAIIFCSQLVVLTMASTYSSIFALVFAMLAIFIPRIAIFCAGIFAITIPFLHPLLADIAILLGKDATFTGRTLLWEYVIELSAQHPLLGHGFRHASADDEWQRLIAYHFVNDAMFIPHSHNLWVETLYKFGILGMFILAFTLIVRPTLSSCEPIGNLELEISSLLLPFLLAKSALIVPFLGSDALSYLWAFALSHYMLNTALKARSKIMGKN